MFMETSTSTSSSSSSSSMGTNICSDSNIPKDRYYRVLHQIKANENIIYVFLGQIYSKITTILKQITDQGKQSLNPDQLKTLKNVLGEDYQKILALNLNGQQIYYIPELIEFDDSVAQIKQKIAYWLTPSRYTKFLYLYLQITESKNVGLGHAFIEKKETKKAVERLINFPANPYQQLFDPNNPDPVSQYFIIQGTPITKFELHQTDSALISDYQPIDDKIYLVTFDTFIQQYATRYVKMREINDFKFGYLFRYWPNLTNNSHGELSSMYDQILSKKKNSIYDIYRKKWNKIIA